MFRLMASLLVLMFLPSLTLAQSSVGTAPADFSIRLGFGLCPQTQTLPPIEEATMCSGYYPELFNVHLDLEPTPAADPSWLLYTGELKTQHQFQDILTTVEVSALYLKANGKIYGIIQGRILNNKGLPPTYFSVSSETGFAGLSKTTIRGFPIAYTSNGHTSDYVSRFMISHRQ